MAISKSVCILGDERITVLGGRGAVLGRTQVAVVVTPHGHQAGARQTDYAVGTVLFCFAAVEISWTLYIKPPSPETDTTGRSGQATLAPSAVA